MSNARGVAPLVVLAAALAAGCSTDYTDFEVAPAGSSASGAGGHGAASSSTKGAGAMGAGASGVGGNGAAGSGGAGLGAGGCGGADLMNDEQNCGACGHA